MGSPSFSFHVSVATLMHIKIYHYNFLETNLLVEIDDDKNILLSMQKDDIIIVKDKSYKVDTKCALVSTYIGHPLVQSYSIIVRDR